MAYSLFGQVTAVRKSANGDIEFDFYHNDDTSTFRCSSDPERLGNFSKELTDTLVLTLATDICVEIFFGDDGNPIRIEMEECDDEYDDLDDDSDDDSDDIGD